MQHSPNFNNTRFRYSIQQEVPRFAYSLSPRAGLLAAVKEVICSAIPGNFRPWLALRDFGIGGDCLDRDLNQSFVALHRQRPKVLARPSKNG